MISPFNNAHLICLIQARDFLHEYLDKTIVIKRLKCEETELLDAHFVEDAEDTGFHLFKRAPSGLSDKRHWQEGQFTFKSLLQIMEACFTFMYCSRMQVPYQRVFWFAEAPKRRHQDHNPDESSEMV